MRSERDGPMSFEPTFVTFPAADGRELSARLDLPAGPVRAMALLADCFGEDHDRTAARIIGSELARMGVGVLRLGCAAAAAANDAARPGSAASVADILAAAAYLRARHTAPAILIGHSLAGAAMLAAG